MAPLLQDGVCDGDVPSYRARLLSLHRLLVEVESVTGNETTAGHVLEQWLEHNGFVCSRQVLPPWRPADDGQADAAAERYNVLAWPQLADGRSRRDAPAPTVLVTAHIDTVPPFLPYDIDADDSRPLSRATVIRGRGSVDAKASVAAQIVAVQELLAAGRIQPHNVALLYVVGEEEGGDGMRAFSQLMQEHAGDGAGPAARFAGPLPVGGFPAAIFGEPTDNKLASGHKGLLIGTITARGKAGHSGYPWLGASANELLMRAMVAAMDADLGSSAEFGQTTLNIGHMEGGVAGNVIAETASADVVLRVASGPQVNGHEIVKAALLKILHAVDPHAFSVEWRGGYGAVPCYHNVPGFDKIMVNFGTDAPVLAGDYMRILYGPGTILVAHADHEALTLGELEQSVEDYKTLILHALKAKGSKGP